MTCYLLATLAEELNIEHQVWLVRPVGVAVDVFEPLELASAHVVGGGWRVGRDRPAARRAVLNLM